LKRWLGILGSVLGLAACYWTATVLFQTDGIFSWNDAAYVTIYTLIFVAALYGAWHRYRRTVLAAGILASVITFLGIHIFITASLVFIPGSLLVLITGLDAENDQQKKTAS
jgi:hypothetical protein